MIRKIGANVNPALRHAAAWPGVTEYGELQAGAHRVAWRRVGPADRPAWVVLHGGPGSGSNPALLRPLASALERGQIQVLLLDQRGSGASRPRAWRAQTGAHHLLRDLEALRESMGLERWSVLGGSWGATLALAYARQHPERLERVVVRGTFTLSRSEVAGVLQPRLYAGERRQLRAWGWRGSGLGTAALLHQLSHLFQSGTLGLTQVKTLGVWQWLETRAAIRGWQRSLRAARQAGNGALARAQQTGLLRLQRSLARQAAHIARPRAAWPQRLLWQKFRLQAHLLRSRAGLPRLALSEATRALARQGVPIDWVHGRHDAVCPPRRAWALHQRLPAGLSHWHWATGGHLGVEPDVEAALRRTLQPGGNA